jgi:uncharacterized membrane protein YvbJ
MSYCPKCGGKVEETNLFCPTCGTALKVPTTPIQTIQTTPVQTSTQCGEQQTQEKQEPQENPENSPIVELQKKNQYGSVNYLIGGLILIVVGIFSIVYLTSRFLATGQTLAVMLIVIGVIIISGAVYVHVPVERFFQHSITSPKNNQ